jgi:DNA-binding MarR family transcriptional regulator
MIDRLVAAGLVDRWVPADNRRETRLRLTDAGKRAVRNVNTRRRRDIRAIIERVPADQRAPLAAAMAAFAEAADELWPDTVARSA